MAELCALIIYLKRNQTVPLTARIVLAFFAPFVTYKGYKQLFSLVLPRGSNPAPEGMMRKQPDHPGIKYSVME